jgi:hypothetical protein
MKKLKPRAKRALIIILIVIFAFVAAVILFLSPIAKYIVEKNDVKWTGREIKIGVPYVNPFTGYVYFSNVRIYEVNSDSVMLSVGGLSGTFNMRRMLRGFYEIDKLLLDEARGNIVQFKKDFNFTSFIEHMSPDEPDTTGAPSSFNILQLKIENSEFHYLQKEIPVIYFIKEVNIESTGKLFDADSVEFKFDFLSGPGTGSIDGVFHVHFKTQNYGYSINVHEFDLTQVEQYMKDMSNYGSFRAKLDANMTSVGNFKDAQDVTSRGRIAISDFHVGKNRDEDYASFDTLKLAILELGPKNKKYIFDTMALIHPFFKYEQYDRLDNLQRMFGKKGANIEAAAADPEKFNLILEIARYVKILSRNFFQSYYRINHLAIDSADLRYNDYALIEKFAIAVNPMTIRADSIDKNHERVAVSFNTKIEPYGSASISLNVNPKDTGDFDMSYHFDKIPVSMFNPYLITHTSFPLDRGTIEIKGNWTVRESKIKSDNHLIIIDPRAAKRIKNKNTKWIPLPLVFSFVREYGNVIDYEIPITGSLKNPKFYPWDVITDILGNVFIKPVMTPYRMEVKDVETEIEKSLSLAWQMRQTKLANQQERFVEKMAEFLKKTPEASIVVSPQQYALKEKEYILFFEAKKKYFLSQHKKDIAAFSKEDSEEVSKMSAKDSLFIQYLDKHVKDSMLFTVQGKCIKLIGEDKVNARFKDLNEEREKTFLSYFRKEGVESRVKFKEARNVIPYNGFSFYKIEYEGELPKALTKAYEKIRELNDEAPRKNYERAKVKVSEQ